MELFVLDLVAPNEHARTILLVARLERYNGTYLDDVGSSRSVQAVPKDRELQELTAIHGSETASTSRQQITWGYSILFEVYRLNIQRHCSSLPNSKRIGVVGRPRLLVHELWGPAKSMRSRVLVIQVVYVLSYISLLARRITTVVGSTMPSF